MCNLRENIHVSPQNSVNHNFYDVYKLECQISPLSPYVYHKKSEWYFLRNKMIYRWCQNIRIWKKWDQNWWDRALWPSRSKRTLEQISGASETAKIADSLLVEAGGLCYEEASAISKEIISGIEPLNKLAKPLEDSVKLGTTSFAGNKLGLNCYLLHNRKFSP